MLSLSTSALPTFTIGTKAGESEPTSLSSEVTSSCAAAVIQAVKSSMTVIISMVFIRLSIAFIVLIDVLN